MKHFLRDSIISFLTISGISFMYRARIKKKGPLVRVIVFHDVRDVEWFRKIVSYIVTYYHVLTPEEFLESRFNATRINVLITFDDGYASWVDVCLPELLIKKIHALFFVNSGLLDCAESPEKVTMYVKERLQLLPRKILTWGGAGVLARAGHMIGGHTITHARLSALQEDMQKDEILKDKERIETVLGHTITAFAYPFGQRGDYTITTKRVVKEAGYTHAFTTESAFVTHGAVYAIPRLCLEEGQSVVSLKYWVEGGYDLYTMLKNICVR